jgi:hypothetical protein
MTVKPATDTRSILVRAREAMTGLAAADAAIAQVRAEMLAAVKPGGAVNQTPVIQATVTALLDGQPVPADLGDQLVAVEDAQRATQARLRGLTTIRDHLTARRQDIRRTQVDAGLTVLATELAAVITEARPIAAKLGPIRDAQAAIDAGLSAEWQQIRELAARHAELRQAQLILTQDALHPSDNPTTVTTVISRDVRDLVEAHGYIRNTADHPAVPNSRIRETGADPTGFGVDIDGTLIGVPHTSTATPPWLDDDPITALAFLAGPAAEPWVPTLRQLTQTRDAAIAAKRRDADINRSVRASAAQDRTDHMLRTEQVRADVQRARVGH